MSDIEFLSVLAMMRYNQKKSFATRQNQFYKESVRLEGIIDREIQRRISQEDKGALKLAYAKYDGKDTSQLSLGI